MFEHIGSHFDVNDVIDNQFAETGQEVASLM